MLKIMLKEPVGGMISSGDIRENKIAARQTHFMLATEDIDADFEITFDRALDSNECLVFTTLDGKRFLIPARNIAYILETDE